MLSADDFEQALENCGQELMSHRGAIQPHGGLLMLNGENKVRAGKPKVATLMAIEFDAVLRLSAVELIDDPFANNQLDLKIADDGPGIPQHGHTVPSTWSRPANRVAASELPAALSDLWAGGSKSSRHRKSDVAQRSTSMVPVSPKLENARDPAHRSQ